MDDEEKLLGMMAIIEEQQKAIKHLTESTADNNEHFQQQLMQQQNHLFKKHGEVINQYDDLFKKHLAELNDRGEQWLNWRKLALTVTVTTTCCLVVVAGFSFYLHYLTGWIAEAKINIAELKRPSTHIRAFSAGSHLFGLKVFRNLRNTERFLLFL